MVICKNCLTKINGDYIACEHCGSPIHEHCKQQCVMCGLPLCDDCAPKHKWKCPTCEKIAVYEMEFISSTMFEAFEKCPYLFKDIFILNKGLELPNKWSRTGQELHALFDKWSYIDNKDVDAMKAEYAEMFDSIDKDLFDDEEERAAFLKQGYTTILNWIVEEKDKPKPLMTEQIHFVQLHDELPKIRATIDRVNGDKNDVANWEVEDYKTGKVYTSVKLRNNMQLPIYAMVIKAVYGELPKLLRLRFPLHQTERVFERITDDLYTCQVKRGGTYNISLSETLNNMVEIYKKIKSDSFKPNTQDIHFCENFCILYKQKKCMSFTTKWQMLMRRGY